MVMTKASTFTKQDRCPECGSTAYREVPCPEEAKQDAEDIGYRLFKCGACGKLTPTVDPEKTRDYVRRVRAQLTTCSGEDETGAPCGAEPVMLDDEAKPWCARCAAVQVGADPDA